MHTRYHKHHWNAFVEAGYEPQGAVGNAPQQWAESLPNTPNTLNYSDEPQTRQKVRQKCRDVRAPLLEGYIYAMAWGGQNDRFGHKSMAWHNRKQIEKRLHKLRENNFSHCEAYNLFTGENEVPGLGPSFFTKLIYFFSPVAETGRTGYYIMDQWTSKSVNLLTQQKLVRLAKTKHASPDHNNKCGNYEAFCHEIEHIATALGLSGSDAGDQVEQRLMSKGGNDPQPWRQHVRDNWPINAPAGRYNRAALHTIYPSIPLNYF